MLKRDLAPVEGERVVLRLLEEADLPLTLSWRNQDHIRTWFLRTDVILEKDHYAWFERYRDLDNDFIFVILAKDLNHIPVGQISLYDINWNTGSAEYGRLMIGDPLAKGKGYAKEATRFLLEYGFMQMGLKEIHLEVKEENEPAIAVYKTAGFFEIARKNGLVWMSVSSKDNFTAIQND